MKRITLLPLLLIMITGYTQNTQTMIKFVNPPTVPAPHGYSQASVVDLGNCKMIYISGQVALDKDGNLVGKDDIEKQTAQVFQNIKNIAESEGGSMNDIVKLVYYVTDISQIQTVRTVRDQYVNINNPPASTLTEVSKLFRPDILIEIDATVVVPRKFNKKTVR